jgi:hypothetical protein
MKIIDPTKCHNKNYLIGRWTQFKNDQDKRIMFLKELDEEGFKLIEDLLSSDDNVKYHMLKIGYE